MSTWGDIVETAEYGISEPIDAFEELANGALRLAEDAAKRALEIAEEGYEWISGTAEEIEAWVERKIEELEHAVEDVEKAIDSVISTIDAGLKKLVSTLHNWETEILNLVTEATHWVHEHMGSIGRWIVDELIPWGWSVLKLLAMGAMLLAAWPLALAAIFICGLVTKAYGEEYGTVIEQILKGTRRYTEMFHIKRLPARACYFISSDLHMYPDSDLDASWASDTMQLYRGVLRYYASKGYGLIENGDVEDYWLRGGSGYGVAYDVSGYLPAPFFDTPYAQAETLGMAIVHLREIVRRYKQTYGLINSEFHQFGKYYRTVGNHDDVYSFTDPDGYRPMVDALAEIYPGIDVYDYLVLEDEHNPVGLVAHGHQTDAWNSGACSYLGRIGTAVKSSLVDLSFGKLQLGIKATDDTTEFWDLKASNVLDYIGFLSGYAGAEIEGLSSLDEVALFRSYKCIWGNTDNHGPQIILGHTHVPLSQAVDPHDDTNGWLHYYNSGCTWFPKMLTGIEWDGTVNPLSPTIRLVAWRYGRERIEPDREPIPEVDDNAREGMVRRVFIANKENYREFQQVEDEFCGVPHGLW